MGLVLGVGSGIPIGKEGPFVHVACMVAELLMKLPMFGRIKQVCVCVCVRVSASVNTRGERDYHPITVLDSRARLCARCVGQATRVSLLSWPEASLVVDAVEAYEGSVT